MDELAFTGLDYTDLLLMDEAERRKVLEDTDLAPDDSIDKMAKRG